VESGFGDVARNWSRCGSGLAMTSETESPIPGLGGPVLKRWISENALAPGQHLGNETPKELSLQSRFNIYFEKYTYLLV
jgi:hypothetical protein